MGIAKDAVRKWWEVSRQDMTMAFMPANAQYTAKRCSSDGVKAGAKAGAIACIATALPLMIGARAIPWARANLNYAAHAHIISLAGGAAYFIVADKTILASARQNSFEKMANH
ncbi:hypothetical protein KI387_019619, partial [Taxus chinensis]